MNDDNWFNYCVFLTVRWNLCFWIHSKLLDDVVLFVFRMIRSSHQLSTVSYSFDWLRPKHFIFNFDESIRRKQWNLNDYISYLIDFERMDFILGRYFRTHPFPSLSEKIIHLDFEKHIFSVNIIDSRNRIKIFNVVDHSFSSSSSSIRPTVFAHLVIRRPWYFEPIFLSCTFSFEWS